MDKIKQLMRSRPKCFMATAYTQEHVESLFKAYDLRHYEWAKFECPMCSSWHIVMKRERKFKCS